MENEKVDINKTVARDINVKKITISLRRDDIIVVRFDLRTVIEFRSGSLDINSRLS